MGSSFPGGETLGTDCVWDMNIPEAWETLAQMMHVTTVHKIGALHFTKHFHIFYVVYHHNCPIR